MAARKRDIRHDAATREKIRTSQLVNRLQNNAIGRLKPELTSGRIKCIEILLRKSLPDLTSVEVAGAGGGPIQHQDVGETSPNELARRIAFALVGAAKEGD